MPLDDKSCSTICSEETRGNLHLQNLRDARHVLSNRLDIVLVQVLVNIGFPYPVSVPYLHCRKSSRADQAVNGHVRNAHQVSDLAHGKKIGLDLFLFLLSQVAHPSQSVYPGRVWVLLTGLRL